MKRRDFNVTLGIASGMIGLSTIQSCTPSADKNESANKSDSMPVSEELAQRMYDKALSITKSKIRGGDSEPYFKKPFIDAAFNNNIFLWDTCFMVCFCKYHMDELPVYQALDNFYDQMEEDGFICREYRKTGEALWSKDHPVSINPPLLAFAELEVFNVKPDLERLRKVYPILKKNFQFHVDRYMMEDNLFYGDTMGLGMDNILRSPVDWEPTEGNGWTHHELGDQLASMQVSDEEKLQFFVDEYVKTKTGVWNKQGRCIDFTCQMAMYALQLKDIASKIGEDGDIEAYDSFHGKVKTALNELCWSEEDSFYYDMGFGEQIPRKHIGMYWALLAEVVPEERLPKFISHLTDPNEFYRKTPLPALAASEPDYVGWGDYWLGGVWAPTVYMVLKGLTAVGEDELAKDLATKVYKNVAIVFDATDTFWENYAPDLISYGMPAKKDFCGWTALIPIAVYKEYIV